MQRRLQQIDAETGEVLQGGTLVFFPQRPRIKEGWLMAFQSGFLKLAQDKSLTQQQWRVFAFLIGKLDFENYIHLSQAEIARGLRMKPSNVSAAVAALVEKAIITRGPRVGRVATLRLTPNLGWKGRVRSLEEQRSKGQLKLVRRTSSSAAGDVPQALSQALGAMHVSEGATVPSAGPDGPKQSD
jgi:hypothetical protein